MANFKTELPIHRIEELLELTGKSSRHAAAKELIAAGAEHLKMCKGSFDPSLYSIEIKKIDTNTLKKGRRELKTSGGWDVNNLLQDLALDISFRTISRSELVKKIMIDAELTARAKGISRNMVWEQPITGNYDVVEMAIENYRKRRLSVLNEAKTKRKHQPPRDLDEIETDNAYWRGEEAER